ncbi:MAG: glycerate kinase [Gaiellaceae bacterium]|jgi:glycerate kinase
MRALAAPASLKGVLSARDAAEALARGLRAGGAEATAVPVADGGDGTLDVLGGSRREAEVSAPLGGRIRVRWALRRDGTAIVESAEPLGFQTVSELDPRRASSRGLGELILAAAGEADSLLVCLGGTVTVDGGTGMREVLDELPLPTRVACDVASPLLDAVYVFAKQKGARAEDFEKLVERLRGLPDVPGAGAAGGLGGAFAALGAELVPGAQLVLDEIGFDPGGYDLVVTGEGAVDETTWAGKAPGEVVRRCREAGVRCELFSARDDLSGDPARAEQDLEELGRSLSRSGMAGV